MHTHATIIGFLGASGGLLPGRDGLRVLSRGGPGAGRDFGTETAPPAGRARPLGLVSRPAPGCGLDPRDVAGQEPPGTRAGALRAVACTVLARVAKLDGGAA